MRKPRPPQGLKAALQDLSPEESARFHRLVGSDAILREMKAHALADFGIETSETALGNYRREYLRATPPPATVAPGEIRLEVPPGFEAVLRVTGTTLHAFVRPATP